MLMICSSILVYTYINTHKHTTNCFTLLRHCTSIHLSHICVGFVSRGVPHVLDADQSPLGFFTGCMSCCLAAELTVVWCQPGGKCAARHPWGLPFPLSLDILVIYSCSAHQTVLSSQDLCFSKLSYHVLKQRKSDS